MNGPDAAGAGSAAEFPRPAGVPDATPAPPVAAAVVAALLASAAAAAFLRRHAALLRPVRPWPAPGWEGGDVVAFFGVMLAAIFLAAAACGPESSLAVRMAGSACGSLVGVFLVVGMLRARGVGWDSIGLTSFDPGGDFRLALVALALVTGPLLLLAAALDGMVKYEHPVIDTLAGERSPSTIVVVALSAVVAAPIAEELFFRRILLGWLDARFPSPGGAVAIAVAALAFGLAHYGQGLAWIPLVALGAVLGVLARSRGSLVPAIALHALFNSVSVFLLLVQPPGSR